MYKVYRGAVGAVAGVKLYKDMSIKFSYSPVSHMSDKNMVECWFMSEDDAIKIVEMWGTGYVSKARRLPDSPMYIKVDGIPVVIDANNGLSHIIFNIFKKSASKDIDESFIYKKLENNGKLKLQDMSTKDATHITIKRYKDNEQLFDIKQETDEDDLHFYVRIDNGRETFEYSRKIETQQDFIKALEQTISALENYNEFSSHRDDLIDVLDEFK